MVFAIHQHELAISLSSWTFLALLKARWGRGSQGIWSACLKVKSESESCSVVSNSLWLQGLYSPWNSPGQATGVSGLSLLQGIFPTQGLNPSLPHCRLILYQLSHKGSPQLVGGVCSSLGSVSPQQKFEVMDGPVLQLSFIWQAKENASWRHEGWLTQKFQREERPEAQFWLLFLWVFLLPLNLPRLNWAGQEGCLFHLRFSLFSSDLPLFYFHRLFPSLSFSHIILVSFHLF